MPTAISVTLLRLSVRGSVKARSSGAAVTNSNRYHFKSVGAAPFCLSGWGQWPGPTLATLGWAPFPPLRAAHRAAPAPGLTVGVMVERADIHGWLNWPNVSIPQRRWRREYARSIGGVTAGGITFFFNPSEFYSHKFTSHADVHASPHSAFTVLTAHGHTHTRSSCTNQRPLQSH